MEWHGTNLDPSRYPPESLVTSCQVDVIRGNKAKKVKVRNSGLGGVMVHVLGHFSLQ